MPSTSSFGIEDEEDTQFDSPEDEIAHYRDKYRQAIEMLSDTRAELEEFQQSSKELEDEMEQELSANDKQQADLREKIKRLEQEKDEWKNKHIALQKMHSSTTSAMQREMDNLRVAASSLLDMESRYNRAIEEKTLLEQDVATKDEMEAEAQRLKDEVRDANEEISILKDQLARAISTPPSSVSTASPTHEPIRKVSRSSLSEDSSSSPLPPPVPSKTDSTHGSPRPRMTRSGTLSSIPVPSPSTKRFSHIPQSPSTTSLSRSTTSRNLAAAAGTPLPNSPAGLTRSRSGIPQASPARVSVIASHQQTKSRGFKLLHDLQARLKATDDKLGGAKVPRRNVSGTGATVFGAVGAVGRRVTSTSSTATARSKQTDIAPATTLNRSQTTPLAQASALPRTGSVMSPGWVLVGEGDDTPTGPWSMTLPTDEPQSPLDPNFRSTSTTSSNRSLPMRPGIPSPLASGLARSSTTSGRLPSGRPPSRLAQSTTKRDLAARPMSPTHIPIASARQNSRPMSPSLIPTASSRPLSPEMWNRSESPALGFSALGQSTSASSSRLGSDSSSAPNIVARPPSRSGLNKRNPIGRGPPPTTTSRLHHHHSRGSLSAIPAASTGIEKVERAKRLGRPSSMGGEKRSAAGEKGSGAMAGRPNGARPSSVHTFNGTPPPVPRIPSSILRDKGKKI
ncbi:hypothetical protein L198_04854 [Cryptococcus wingfieldii CBS 7118]|uniref:NUDE domain-containing protein n=1 Tax=Cryptococcus wingfieldii CBS 7118 TaxID=1295528 RepID=A0A1E3J1K4_9TREE|nr:hypothetical protein L198_04854 [Cryptococcus wingfieldii CBS 7118]ODN94712.1 hypothetical protein L198_04854 [Cryptococcus wingfieldii CBS 7118]